MAADPEWLDKIRSIRTVSKLSGDRVDEGRDSSGDRYKATTDELGNTVIGRKGDRQDVVIGAPLIAAKTSTTEVRN